MTNAQINAAITEIKAELVFHKQHPEMLIVWACYFYFALACK